MISRNEQNIKESKVLSRNAEFLGYDLSIYFKKFSQLFVIEVLKGFTKSESFSIICGLGGNGADGLGIARELIQKNKKVSVFIIGRPTQSDHPEFLKIYQELQNIKDENLKIYQDCYAKDIIQNDILIEALVGTGLVGAKLTKRYKDVIDRISHFTCPLIAVDAPSPHYSADFVYSINYPKVAEAITIPIAYPEELRLFCGPGEYEALWEPNTSSHKNKNGKVLFISDQVSTIPQNVFEEYPTTLFIHDFNKSNQNIEQVALNLEDNLNKSVSVLFDFDTINILNLSLIEFILKKYKNKKYILKPKLFTQLDSALLKNNEIVVILTQEEIAELLQEKRKVSPTLMEGDLKRFAINQNCFILSLGSKTFLYSPTGEHKIVKVNPSVSFENLRNLLASYTAAYAAKNDTWLALRACVVHV